MKNFLTILLLLFVIPRIDAATFTWIGNDGLWSEPSNWDLDDVPKPLDIVIIMGSSSQVTMDVDVEIKRLEISDGAGLLVPAGKTLTVIGDVFGDFTDNILCYDGGIVNHGTITVEDSLILKDSEFWNMGTGLVHNNGNFIGWFELDHTGIAVVNEGEISMGHLMTNGHFTNRGTINSNVSSSGSFINTSLMSGSITHGGTFTNDGVINSWIRVGVFGSFENNDRIVIEREDGNTNGIEVFGTFTNDHVVDIRKLSNPVAPCIGISIKDGSNFVNNAFIDIDSVEGVGIRSEADLVTNEEYGTIRINDIIPYNASLGYGIVLTDAPGENDGSNFVNDGLIWIEDIEGFGIQFDDNNPSLPVTLTNNNLIDIKEAFNGGIEMVEYQAPFFPIRGHFVNNPNADLRVNMSSNGGQRGIKCRLTNYGQIEVSDYYNTGIEGYLVNHGEVNTNGTARGMSVEYFNNASTGQINSENDIYTDSINNYYGPSVNEGIINIKSGLLWVEQHIINKPCGTIAIDESIVTYDSKTLINQGLLLVNGFPADLQDSLYNSGVIYDQLGSLAGDDDFFNEGVYITKVMDPYACGDMISNISSGNNVANIPSPSVSKDKAGLISAGTYDLPNHKVTLAGTTEGMDTLYTHFLLASGCDRTVPIAFEEAVTCSSNCNDNFWTGNISNDWHTAGNWSESMIPTSCQSVKINGSMVLIATGMTGTCLFLEVAVGATLEVNGQLDVIGN